MWLKIQLLRDEAASLNYVMETCVQEVKQIEQWLQMYKQLSSPNVLALSEKVTIVEEVVMNSLGKKMQIRVEETKD